MFRCIFQKEDVIKSLYSAVNIADKKHTMPILSFFLVESKDNYLLVKASDLDTEILIKIRLNIAPSPGKITLPARKFIDIIKNLPNESEIEIIQKDECKIFICSNFSKFILLTQKASDFPNLENDVKKSMFKISLNSLSQIIKSVQFSMANNDVRYFLNGMLWEIHRDKFKAVSTDGHRMAISQTCIEDTYLDRVQLIIPRKTISDLRKIIGGQTDSNAEIQISSNYFKLILSNCQFTSKLIDATYPDYKRVFPQKNNMLLVANRLSLKLALMRTSVLSNEKYRGIKLNLKYNQLIFSANNPNQEEAFDQIDVKYNGSPMEIGFNVNYLLDVVNVVDSKDINLYFESPEMSLLIEDSKMGSKYVISPVRL